MFPINEKEIVDVRKTIESMKTKQDVLNKLGHPDEEYDWFDEIHKYDIRIKKFTKQYTYNKKWNSLVLIVQIFPDDTIQCSFHAKENNK